MKGTKGVLRYLKGTLKKQIVYNGATDFKVFCDADYAGDIDTRRSKSEFVALIGYGCVSWSSRLQQTVALFTTEAEYMAAAEAGKEVLWFKKLFNDFGVLDHMGISKVYWDNQRCIKLTENPVLYKRSKQIDVGYHFIREQVEKEVLELHYCPTTKMIADILKKPLPYEKVQWCTQGMGIIS